MIHLIGKKKEALEAEAKAEREQASRVMASDRENAAFHVWWEAYKLVLAARATRGDTPFGAAEYAHTAATAAEVDYRERSILRTKRIAETWTDLPILPPGPAK